MTSIDFTPLYRNTIGFDRFDSLLNAALGAQKSTSAGYPPYNIEVVAEDRYDITLAVAGFVEDELDIHVENSVLTISGNQKSPEDERKYLHEGIASRSFERKFTLADHVEITAADLRNGLLKLSLVRIVPEAMKPRKITINGPDKVLDHKASEKAA